MSKPKTDDPDIRNWCQICRGPIYYDEPGYRCPDCLHTMAIAHQIQMTPPPEKLGRCERPVRVSMK